MDKAIWNSSAARLLQKWATTSFLCGIVRMYEWIHTTYVAFARLKPIERKRAQTYNVSTVFSNVKNSPNAYRPNSNRIYIIHIHVQWAIHTVSIESILALLLTSHKRTHKHRQTRAHRFSEVVSLLLLCMFILLFRLHIAVRSCLAKCCVFASSVVYK